MEGKGEKESYHQETVSLGKFPIGRVSDCSLSPERKAADPGMEEGRRYSLEEETMKATNHSGSLVRRIHMWQR